MLFKDLLIFIQHNFVLSFKYVLYYFEKYNRIMFWIELPDLKFEFINYIVMYGNTMICIYKIRRCIHLLRQNTIK